MMARSADWSLSTTIDPTELDGRGAGTGKSEDLNEKKYFKVLTSNIARDL
jgi:hypothetical protein